MGGVFAFLIMFILVARITRSTVNVDHTFNANVDKVWKLWNDPESIQKWWSPKNYTSPVVKNDFRVGGRFLMSMKSPNGELFWNTGTYKEIDPEKMIDSTMSFSDENGKPVPGSDVKVPGIWPDEVRVTVRFKEVDGKTIVSVQEAGVPLLMNFLAKMGWEQQFEKFEALL